MIDKNRTLRDNPTNGRRWHLPSDFELGVRDIPILLSGLNFELQPDFEL